MKSALIESRLKDDGRLAVAFVFNAGAVGRGEMLRLGFAVIDPAAAGDGFVIENARGWTLDSGAEVPVTIETPPTKISDVKERQASEAPAPQIEYRLPPWAYAVGGVGATTIFFLLVMLVRAETKTR